MQFLTGPQTLDTFMVDATVEMIEANTFFGAVMPAGVRKALIAQGGVNYRAMRPIDFLYSEAGVAAFILA